MKPRLSALLFVIVALALAVDIWLRLRAPNPATVATVATVAPEPALSPRRLPPRQPPLPSAPLSLTPGVVDLRGLNPGAVIVEPVPFTLEELTNIAKRVSEATGLPLQEELEAILASAITNNPGL